LLTSTLLKIFLEPQLCTHRVSSLYTNIGRLWLRLRPNSYYFKRF